MIARLLAYLSDGDDLIDQLVRDNTAKPIPGYEKADHEIINSIGKKKWEQTYDAQRRLKTHPSRGKLGGYTSN